MSVVSVGVLSGRGLFDELITRPDESYRLWCVVVCDLETSRITCVGSQRHSKKGGGALFEDVCVFLLAS